jgi:MFS family permease
MLASNESDVLLVIAQLSVAFAGFASLASALSDRSHRDETRVDAGRLINMLIISLCTAMLALAPSIPMLFGLAEQLVWRSSAAIAFVTLVLFAPGVLMRTKRMKKYVGFSIRTNVVNMSLAAIAAFAFGFCAFGLPALKPSASYVMGLMALLLTCAIVFFQVIASLLRPHAPE